MLDAYLGDILQSLKDQRWDEAQEAAVALPRIAVALANPQLQSSCDHYREWCSAWVQPSFDDSVYSRWCALSMGGKTEPAQCVPSAALRELRLRRLARTGAAQTGPLLVQSYEPQGNAVTELCVALIAATRKWYVKSARHDQVVQSNLARLGIFR
jgi:hypothetical protein